MTPPLQWKLVTLDVRVAYLAQDGMGRRDIFLWRYAGRTNCSGRIDQRGTTVPSAWPCVEAQGIRAAELVGGECLQGPASSQAASAQRIGHR